MNNISSSNYYNVSSSSNTNISMAGLVSGMDTEKMVTQMLSGTQSKIDKLNQQKQQINWKTEIYQDIVSSINNFRNTYFDSSYGASAVNNLANKNFFNTMASAITSGDSVRIVSTTTEAQPRDMSIKVNQLATAAQLKSTQKMSGDQSITGGSINADKIEKLLSAEGGQYSFDLSLDGVSKAITLTAEDFNGKDINEENIAEAIKDKVKQAFGDYIKVDTTDNKLKFSINITDDDGNIEAGHEMRITGITTDAIGIKAGSSSHVSMMDTLGSLSGVTGDTFEFSINGENFSFDKDTSISKMMSTINSSKAGVKLTYSSITDTFSMEATNTGSRYGIEITQTQGDVLSRIFGESVISAPAEDGTAGSLNQAAVTSGKDALLEIDGVSTSRSSNTFTIDGITMSAVKVSTEETKIGTQRDVDSIVDGIKAFVNDYNAMMTKLTELTSEKAEYKNYPPLTEAQKAEMTPTQVELWEKNAKLGLVRNDPDLTNFMEAMKRIPYSIASKSGIGLFSIGIDTKPWDKTGALEIDEAALRSAIESNPDTVIDLFTDKSSDSAVKGIAAQMAEVSDYAAKTSAGSPGTLVRLAGAKNYITFEKNNDLYYDLMNINDRLNQLQSRYQQERTRYMNQFTQMEKIMANFSTQSGMLLQQFGGY